MDCKTAKSLIILGLYGELDEGEKRDLEEHLRRCSACAAELAETKKVFSLLDENKPAVLPEVDWEKSWDKIRGGIDRRPAKNQQSIFPRWKWAFAGALLALVLGAGVFIGKYWFAPAPKPAIVSIPASSGATSVQQAFAGYLEDVKPILLDYAHYTPGEKNGRRITVDENILRGLVFQNILLKRKLAEKDPVAAELLDDLDLVLKEITNRGTQDPQSPAGIKDLIEQRDVLFKLEIMKKL